MKKVVVILAVLFLMLIVVAVGFFQMQKAAQAAGSKVDKDVTTVERGDILLKVIETGTIDAKKSVDVRSRASGRLARQLVDEGDFVTGGQLIAVIDPQEVEFRVAQDQAQLRGARSGAARTTIELEQRKVTAKAAYDQALSRLDQLRQELKAQPTLTSASISFAQASLNSSNQDLQRLSTSVHPTQRTAAESELSDAKIGFETTSRDRDRVLEQEKKGYVATQALDAANLRYQQARTRRDKAETDLNRLTAQQRLEIETAKENVRRAQADFDRAMANRIQDTVKKREFESALAAVDSARAQLRDVDVLRRSYEQGMATVSQLQSVVGDSMRQLRETQVRAPMDGIVSKKSIEVGDMVTGLSAFTQGTAIFRIEDRTALRVKLEINEIDVARLRKGMPVLIDVDAYPEKAYRGVVKKIAPSSTAMQPSAPGTAGGAADAVVKYEVEVWFDRPDTKLRSGMSAKCTFETLNRKNVLRLPVEFLGKDKDGDFVMLAPPKGSKDKSKRMSVVVGAKSGAFAEILSGVKVGDRVSKPAFTGPPRKGFMSGPGDEEQQQQADEKQGGGSGESKSGVKVEASSG